MKLPWFPLDTTCLRRSAHWKHKLTFLPTKGAIGRTFCILREQTSWEKIPKISRNWSVTPSSTPRSSFLQSWVLCITLHTDSFVDTKIISYCVNGSPFLPFVKTDLQEPQKEGLEALPHGAMQPRWGFSTFFIKVLWKELSQSCYLKIWVRIPTDLSNL